MTDPVATVSLAGSAPDPAAPVPLYRQLYDGLRDAILAGRLVAGTRLPSTRALAAELGLARATVVNAFEQLLAEGYVEGRVGAGTYVARTLPDDLLRARATAPPAPRPAAGDARLSRRGALLAATPATVAPSGGPPRAFRPGLPALDAFPFDLWARLLARRARRPPRDLPAYGDPAGYRPLREAIAGYLGAARAVACAPEQVIVTAGSQGALDLAARLLLDPGDPVWVEEPGYPGARGALLGAGARLIPVPTDGEGLVVADGIARCPAARLAYVTPSHQYPLGATLSLARRLALLAWAREAGARVLEDDYDSEYRYAGRPLAALQGLDDAGRVLYLGTFSKVLFPALRLGYLVVPPALVDAFAAARALVDRHPPALEQAALADFIAEGHFARHIRRMRVLYAARQAALVEAARRDLTGLLAVAPHDSGMHLVGRLPAGADGAVAARLAVGGGIELPAVASYCLQPARRGDVLLGYAAFDEATIRAAIRGLAVALRPLQP
jgi:GntR family transcriptional regulator/MocR family aminotransferase